MVVTTFLGHVSLPLSSSAGAQHARYSHQCQDEAPQGQGNQYINLWMKIFCYKQRKSVEHQESSVWWRLRVVWRWCIKCGGRKTTITNQIGLWLAKHGGMTKCSIFMGPCTSQHDRLISFSLMEERVNFTCFCSNQVTLGPRSAIRMVEFPLTDPSTGISHHLPTCSSLLLKPSRFVGYHNLASGTSYIQCPTHRKDWEQCNDHIYM